MRTLKMSVWNSILRSPFFKTAKLAIFISFLSSSFVACGKKHTSTPSPASAALKLSAKVPTSPQVNMPYSQSNAASGGKTPYSYSLSAGAMPEGLSLEASSGKVSGTPTVGGSFSYTIQVTDARREKATAKTTNTIASALSLTATPSDYVEVGAAYAQHNAISGGSLPYSCSVVSGTLPTGTSLNSSNGTVSGTPTVPGTYSYTIECTDAANAIVSTKTNVTLGALSLTATPSAKTEVGVAYSQTNIAGGGTTPYIYSIYAGSLPLGLSLNTSSGTVSGTPTTGGSFSYTIEVTDAVGIVETQVTSGIIANTLLLTATPSTFTQVNLIYSQTNVGSGGTSPYSYSLNSGTLPAGTTLNTSTGTVSGTPFFAGSFSYTIEVTDNDGATATASSSGSMISELGLAAMPSINSQVGLAYSQTNTAGGGTAPYTYSLHSGSLPNSTTLNTSTGTVSGTPAAPGSFSYTIEVTDNNGATATASSSGVIFDIGLDF